MKNIEIKLLSKHAKLPIREHDTDSGLDLFSSHHTHIPPFSTVVVNTDVAINLPYGYEAQVRPRSGVTSKTDIRVQLGTIDCGYTGNIGIIIDNHSHNRLTITKHMKLAQLVIAPVVYPLPISVDEFNAESKRGDNGFGSTDKV